MSNNYSIDEYNLDSKIKIIFENTARMFSRRRMYKSLSFEEIYTQFKSNQNGEHTYYSNNENTIEIYLNFDKVTKMGSEEDNMFTNDESKYILYIVGASTPKIIKTFDQEKNSEMAFVDEMLSDRADHVTNPQIELLSAEEQEDVIRDYQLNLRDLPEFKFGTSALARYYQLKKGEIVRIISASECGLSIRYRVCQ